mgnify:CR=1 FL=1
MREIIKGQVFDTAVSTLLGTVEESCDCSGMNKDSNGKVSCQLYISPEKLYFFHRAYPPEYAVSIGAMEEIEPVTDRCQLTEWIQACDGQEAMARAICDADGEVFTEKPANHG